jgi:hypothetical protein
MRRRRGVSSVLAMMFLVLFSSLAVAMAVVSQGNLRTADSALKVSRAMSAAETGLSFASRRLDLEGRRFIITKGVVDPIYADDLWGGTYDPADGDVTILPPQGYSTATPPSGLMYAVRDAHLADSHTLFGETPVIDPTSRTLFAPAIALSDEANPPYFRLTYELRPLDWGAELRVTSVGVDQDISRTLQMRFRIEKKIEFAILSPNRIMIGKNVRVEGPLGSRYGVVAGELTNANADPLVMRSDFYFLDSGLDTSLDIFFAQLQDYDTDGDGRLRVDHPVEVDGVVPPLVDYDGDEYVDDYDLFLDRYDLNPADGRVVYSTSLALAAGLGALTEEFDADLQLARLIDQAVPDRDGDGSISASDTSLGYNDGVIGSIDLYAKVKGRLAFAVARAAWEAAHGDSYQTIVHGPVRTALEQAPVSFEVDPNEMVEITTAMLDSQQTWFYDESLTGADFTTQVNAGIAAGGTFTPPTDWEAVPFGSQGAYDYYQRPIYEDMTFTNVRIPMGENALFVNCLFIGVTYVMTNEDCIHENWNYAGAVEPIDDGMGGVTYQLRFPDLVSESGGAPVPDTRLESNNVRFQACTFAGSISGDKPNEYTHWRNKIQFTGMTRFILDPNDPVLAAMPEGPAISTLLSGADGDELRKSSILMPGWSVDVGNFDNTQAPDPLDTPIVRLQGTIVAGILDARGTVDIHGTLLMTFRPAEGQGPLFYGGQPDAFNTTIGYFGPSDGDGEGIDTSDPAFPGFGEITLRYDPDMQLPDGIPWPIGVNPIPATYYEGEEQ